MSLVLDDIRYFVVVCETLNVTRASERLGITQPTLSYSIKRLEKELNGELLVRLKSGVQLTKLGEEFRFQSRKLLLEWEKAQKLASTFRDEVSGHYTIGCHPSVGLYALENFIVDLMKDFPHVHLKLKHGLSRKITEKVVSWEVDFGIVVNPKPHPDLVIKELCRDEVSIFYKKGCPEVLIYDEALNQTQSLLNKMKKDRYTGFKALCSENLEVIARLAHKGAGYAILPSRVAAQYKNLLRDKAAPSFSDKICLIYRAENARNPSHSRIARFILEAGVK